MKNTLASIICVGFLLSGVTLMAGDIPIANASFELPVLVDGQEYQGSVPGWIGTGIFPLSNPADNWFPGTSTGSLNPNPIDGTNIGGINVGATIHQDLSAALEPGTAYTLRMLVGRRLGVPFGVPLVSLMAGGQVLTQSVPPAPADGTFAPFELI